MSEDEIGSPLYNPKGEGCARYALAAIATILFTPAFIGILLSIAVGDPTALFATIFFGAIIATPLVLVGAGLHAMLARQVQLRWWHSTLTGFMLVLIVIIALTFPTLTAPEDGYWSIILFLVLGAVGGLIFHYFVTQRKTKTGSDDE